MKIIHVTLLDIQLTNDVHIRDIIFNDNILKM